MSDSKIWDLKSWSSRRKGFVRLALVLLNVVGEDVLRESVNALGDEIG